METSKQFDGQPLPSREELREWVNQETVDKDVEHILDIIEQVFEDDTVTLDSPIDKSTRRDLYDMEDMGIVRTRRVQPSDVRIHFHWILRYYD